MEMEGMEMEAEMLMRMRIELKKLTKIEHDKPVPTTEDVLNCFMYADRALKRYKLEKYQRSNQYFRNIIFTETEWPSALHVPPSIKSKDFRSYFTEGDCHQLSCYSPVQSKCDPKRGEITLRISKTEYSGCQPACFDFPGKAMETAFLGGRCVMANTKFKNFCLFPSDRDPNGKNVKKSSKFPPPFLWLQDAQECVITEEYCKYFGVEHDSSSLGDCFVPTEQKVAEELFGYTITRWIKNFGKDVDPPTVLRQLGLENTARSKRSLVVEAYNPYEDAYMVVREFWGSPSSTSEVTKLQKFSRAMLTLMHAIALEQTLLKSPAIIGEITRVSYRVMNRTLKRILRRGSVKKLLGRMGSKVLVRSFLRVTAVRMVYRFTTAKLLALLSLNLSPIGYLLTATSLAGVALDYWDPLGLRTQTSREGLRYIKAAFEDDYEATFGLWPYELTPETFMMFMERSIEPGKVEEEEAEDEFQYFVEKVLEYLGALETNSLGERIDLSSVDYDESTIDKEIKDYKTQILELNARNFSKRSKLELWENRIYILILFCLGCASFLWAYAELSGRMVLRNTVACVWIISALVLLCIA